MYDTIEYILCRYYGILSKSMRISAINGTALKIERGSDSYLFKFHDKERLNDLDKIRELHACLNKKEFIPEMIPTNCGYLIGADKNILFSLNRWIDCQSYSDGYTGLTAEKLARLHIELREIGGSGLRNHIDIRINDSNIFDYLKKFHFDEYICIVEKYYDYMINKDCQIIHNDLHLGNILFSNDDVYFIDFNSASYKNAAVDVANCAFRLSQAGSQSMDGFIEIYNKSQDSVIVSSDESWLIVAYNAIQRILFILLEDNDGNAKWMDDLNQQRMFLHYSLGNTLARQR